MGHTPPSTPTLTPETCTESALIHFTFPGSAISPPLNPRIDPSCPPPPGVATYPLFVELNRLTWTDGSNACFCLRSLGPLLDLGLEWKKLLQMPVSWPVTGPLCSLQRFLPLWWCGRGGRVCMRSHVHGFMPMTTQACSQQSVRFYRVFSDPMSPLVVAFIPDTGQGGTVIRDLPLLELCQQPTSSFS